MRTKAFPLVPQAYELILQRNGNENFFNKIMIEICPIVEQFYWNGFERFVRILITRISF